MIEEIEVLWLTAGLGCDGDTIAITAATQPSIEDLVLGASRQFPKLFCGTLCWPPKTALTFWNTFIGRPRGGLKSLSYW